MSVNINADTTNGLVLTSDTSGEIKLQSAGADIATVNSSGITMASGKTIAGITTGKVLQVVTNRSDARVVYSGSNNYSISELSTSITPISASSLLMIDVHIMYEPDNSDQVFKATKDGSVMTASGYEGYNSNAGNQRWSGIAAMQHDTNDASTPAHTALRFFDAAGSTTSRAYGIDVRTSSSTNQLFYLNRAVSSLGADTIENGVSFVTIMEIAQ